MKFKLTKKENPAKSAESVKDNIVQKFQEISDNLSNIDAEQVKTIALAIAALALMSGVSYVSFKSIDYFISLVPEFANNMGVEAWQLPAASALAAPIVSLLKNGKEILKNKDNPEIQQKLRRAIIEMSLVDLGGNLLGIIAAGTPTLAFDALRKAYEVSAEQPWEVQWNLVLEGLKQTLIDLSIKAGVVGVSLWLVKRAFYDKFFGSKLNQEDVEHNETSHSINVLGWIRQIVSLRNTKVGGNININQNVD